MDGAERLARSGVRVVAQVEPDAARSLTELADVVGISGAVGERFEAARTVVTEGCHVFLAWPPGVSTEEANQLARRAEEAGVEVGAARPLAVSGVLRAAPDGWAARLITLELAVAPDGRLADIPWSHRIAGALDLCATLADSRDAARLDAQAERENGLFQSVAISLRFRSGAYAQAVLRTDDAASFRLDASGPGTRLSARSLEGPLCIEGDAARQPVDSPDPLPPDVREAVSFIEAVSAGRRAPFTLADALATMRLAEAVGEKLRA